MSKFRLTIEGDSLEELKDFVKLGNYVAILFELKNNFHRRFANLDNESEDFHKGVDLVLSKLQEEIEDYDL